MSATSFDKEILAVSRRAWTNPYTCKSNFARQNAVAVAAAASLGLITTEEDPSEFSPRWLVTPRGLRRVQSD